MTHVRIGDNSCAYPICAQSNPFKKLFYRLFGFYSVSEKAVEVANCKKCIKNYSRRF